MPPAAAAASRRSRRLPRWPCVFAGRPPRRLDALRDASCSRRRSTRRISAATPRRVIATDKAFTFLAANAPAERAARRSSSATACSTPTGPSIPASVKIFDGLGPTFNRNSCSGCHVRDGRGRPPETAGEPMESMLVRLSLPVPTARRCRIRPMATSSTTAPSSACRPRAARSSTYDGGPRQPTATARPTRCARRTTRFVDLAFGPLDGDCMISPRVAPAMIGLGLLEAVPDGDASRRSPIPTTPTATASPAASNCADRSRRQAGRSAASAGRRTSPRSREQTAGAAVGDIGITSRALPGAELSAGADRLPAPRPTAATPRSSDTFLDRLVTYCAHARRAGAPRRERPDVAARLSSSSREFGCAACHMPTLQTGGDAGAAGTRDQTFHPFTDLLLHDMGEGLADDRPDGSATGTRVADAAALGPRPHRDASTATTGSCTTAAPAASPRRSSGTAARRKRRKEAFRTAASATSATR